jgi:cytoskeletal protein CcmA (bactofilin family)
MAYTITSSTGVGYTVEDGTINNTFSLKLVGKNVTNYGQVFAENSLRHLENFASPLAPTPNTTLVGQLWYDTNEKVLRIYKDSTAKWVRTTPVVQSTAPADGVSAGAMYFDTTDDKLKIHDGVSYKDSSYAGEVTNEYSNFGNLNTPSAYGTKLRNIYLKDSGDVPRAVSALVYVNDGEASTTRPGGETVMAIFSDHSTFTAKDTAGSSHGDTYNWYDQLAESDGIGIEINPGMNLRQEYANTSIALADRAYRADGLTGNIVIGASNVAITSLVTSASDIIPDAGDTYDLGSSTNRWQNIYVNGILSLGQTGGTAEVRATSANVTTRVGTTVYPITSSNIGDATVNTIRVTNYKGGAGNINIGNVIASGAITSGSLAVSGGAAITGNIDGTIFKGTTAIFTGNGSFGSITNSGATTLNGSVILGDATADKITLNGQINSHLIPDTTVQYNLGSSTRYWNDLYVNTINAAGNMTFAGQLRLTSTSNPSSVSDTNAPLYLDGGAVIEKKLYVGENITSSANVIGNYFVGTATSAQYADLAEIYSSDADYEPGTVVKLGGSAEVTQTTTFNDPEVFGVVSTNPAYLMNAEAEGVAVALTGRVPVKVEGRIKKGERLVSGSKPGYAKALMKNEYDMRCIIGRALQD